MRQLTLILAFAGCCYASNCIDAYTGTMAVSSGSASITALTGSFPTSAVQDPQGIIFATSPSPAFPIMNPLFINTYNSATSITLNSNYGLSTPFSIVNFSAPCTPKEVTATCNSTTWTAQANTAYTASDGTAVASVDSLLGIVVDTAYNPTCTSGSVLPFAFGPPALPGTIIGNAFMPHGFATGTTEVIVLVHGGGGVAGEYCEAIWRGCGTAGPIQLTQFLTGWPNRVGGKGAIIVDVDYPICNSTGTGCSNGVTFQKQVQSLKCSLSAIISGALGFTPTLPIGVAGTSWGGTLALLGAISSTASYGGTSSTCSYSDNRSGPMVVAPFWPLMDFAWSSTAANTEYGNGNSTAVTSVQDALACNSQAACHTADTAATLSPWQQIVSGNLTQISNKLIMTGHTAGPPQDAIVPPTFSGAGGNMSYFNSSMQALGLNPVSMLYPQLSYLYRSNDNFDSNQGHTQGTGTYSGGPIHDMLCFLMACQAGGSSGVSGSGVF